MQNEIKEIAKRIKGLRESEGISLESLAQEFNIPLSLYKKYENGEEDIPIGFLYRIANKFNTDFTSLITGEEPKLHSYCIVRKDKAPIIERRKEYKYLDLSYNFINKKAETFLVTIEPDSEKSKPTNFYFHEGQEFNYVLEGTLKVILNDKELILNEGDSLYFDSNQKHAMFALNNKKVKFIAVIIK